MHSALDQLGLCTRRTDADAGTMSAVGSSNVGPSPGGTNRGSDGAGVTSKALRHRTGTGTPNTTNARPRLRRFTD
ncbi:hypothetical protein MLGJGCBP_02572 [Rhodococcus sp. T7]|nr:hypothetical protein MLGJGCBP_02572 [Rhodococcus sp. T7]